MFSFPVPWSVNLHKADIEKLGGPDKAFSKVVALGASMVRTDFGWSDIEPEEGKFSFDFFDKYVHEANRNQLSLICILSGPPSWAKKIWRENKTKFLEKYAIYCRKVAERYAEKITYFQIWNEPNNWIVSPLSPRPSNSEFAKIIIAGDKELRNVLGKSYMGAINIMCNNDIIGGWVHNLKDIYKHMGKQDRNHNVKIIGIDHYPSTWTNTLPLDWSPLDSLIELIDDNVDRLFSVCQIAIMETGYSTWGLFRDQDRWVNTALPILKDKISRYNRYEKRILFCNWYELLDSGENFPPFEGYFGILDPNGYAKPAFGSLAYQILPRGIERLRSFGTPGGNGFSDSIDFMSTYNLKEIKITDDNNNVHGIECTWQNREGKRYYGTKHGGRKGSQNKEIVKLEDDEYICKIEGTIGRGWQPLLNRIRFTTNKGKVFPTGKKYYGGASDGSNFTIDGLKLVGFYGRSDYSIDNIGFYSRIDNSKFLYFMDYVKSNGHGRDGGNEFSDTPPTALPFHLKEIELKYGNDLNGIRCKWIDQSGTQHEGRQHSGRWGDHYYIFLLDNDEVITNVEGSFGKYLQSLKLETNKNRNSGRIGGEGGAKFAIKGDTVGFFGRAGDLIDKIGILEGKPVKIQYKEHDALMKYIKEIQKIIITYDEEEVTSIKFYMKGTEEALVYGTGKEVDTTATIQLEENEYVSKIEFDGSVTGIIIYSNLKKYGPYGHIGETKMTLDSYILISLFFKKLKTLSTVHEM